MQHRDKTTLEKLSGINKDSSMYGDLVGLIIGAVLFFTFLFLIA